MRKKLNRDACLEVERVTLDEIITIYEYAVLEPPVF